MSASKLKVSELRELLIFSLPLEKQLEIKQYGRPMPELNITRIVRSGNRAYRRLFNPNIYSRNDWICGCEETNRLFCFPCLLFAEGSHESNWTNTGMFDLAHISRHVKKHENSLAHLNSILELNLLGKIDIRQQLNSVYRSSIRDHNELVTKNRFIITKIIDRIIFGDAFDLLLQNAEKSQTSYKDFFFKFLVDLDASLDCYLSQTKVFKEEAHEILDDLLDSMQAVCREFIKNEIKDSSFISLITEDVSDISSSFQRVIVFRYVLSNGQPVERFWKLVNLLERDDVESIAECFLGALQEAGVDPEKLVSQSYDGSSTLNGDYLLVQAIIQQHYIYAHFVHYYAHQLNTIVIQAASQILEVRVFFANLSHITNFFSNAPCRIIILHEIIISRYPDIFTTAWNFENEAATIVFKHRIDLIQCMNRIESTSRQSTVVNQAGAIKRMLRDSTFLFWLKVFDKIMPCVDVLNRQLHKKSNSAMEIGKHINIFQKSMEKVKETFDKVGKQVIHLVVPSPKKIKMVTNSEINIPAADEVCDVISSQIKRRFFYSAYYSAMALFDTKQFQVYQRHFPTKLLSEAIDVYPSLDKDRLMTELGVIYQQDLFRNMSGIITLLQFIIENNLQTLFPETYALVLVLSTVPVISAEHKLCSSALQSIRTLLKSTDSDHRINSVAMISVEKDMMRAILNFNERVMNTFVCKESRKNDFCYKICA